ncbi:methyltransferase [Actinoplanes sp. OR16]|uniref:DNA-methyltransferase n=1 Tax=Actinoplanes sp. OR16 TaxID=946334 RepID=UPI000F6FD89E|nr:site-specific DNA-methyltransferase [Actinoplanes sp. OR16]BBH65299.1 methyltransferase [Actinoplanes sp. OR16]
MTMTPHNLLANVTAGKVIYTTNSGVQVCGDSLDILPQLPANSVDLIVTSPPFPLLRQKEYGNEDQHAYVDWLVSFAKAAKDALKETGSLVIDIGGAYQRGRPVRSLHQYRVLIALVDDLGYQLAEEFYWHNPAKLPSPIEWVNKRKIRVKDSVNTVWWLSKTDFPKVSLDSVRVPYSESMRRLLKNPESYYRPKVRDSGHSIGKAFGLDNGGALPSNLLSYPNSDSNGFYIRTCKELGLRSHPARFPAALPEFFIKMLTHQNDFVLDIFGGSNTTGHVAEILGRKWLSIEKSHEYAALSGVRFLEGKPLPEIREIHRAIVTGEGPKL